jgi:hypothetical protein
LAWGAFLYTGVLLLGGRSRFSQMVVVALAAWLPFALRGLIQSMFILAFREPPGHPGLAGFAAVFQWEGAPAIFVSKLLGQLDVYLFGYLALLVSGTTHRGRIPRRKAAALVGVGWVLSMILAVLPSLASSFAESLASGMWS